MSKRWVVTTLLATVLISVFLLYLLLALGDRCPRGCRWDERRIADLSQIQNAVEHYFSECGAYPGGIPKRDADPACAGVSRPSQLAGPPLNIPNIPRDPVTGVDYPYCYTVDGVSYALQANLKNSQYPGLVRALVAPPASCKNTEGVVTCDRAKGEYCVGP